MTDHTSGSLKELQELDIVLEETRTRIAEFDPLLAEVEEPALALEQDLSATQGRLKEIILGSAIWSMPSMTDGPE